MREKTAKSRKRKSNVSRLSYLSKIPRLASLSPTLDTEDKAQNENQTWDSRHRIFGMLNLDSTSRFSK
ncbi:11222_t:CDS:2 [Diversispora eburnea]|uniref:11222_t:CDS:1 n=1 Tax=Diversispora eburnea TaxID=1213867 RepID=A0A9N9GC18_9GLOM|nr:11222_t:CDS:2 [Diversispora eburnea]